MGCNTPGFPVLHNLLEWLKVMSTELVMSLNHLILCVSLSPVAFNLSQHHSFPMSRLLAPGGQSTNSYAPVNHHFLKPNGLMTQ